MKHVHAITAALLASSAGLAMGQCGTSCTEPADCPTSFIQSFGYISPVCCAKDSTTTRLCSKYKTTYTAVDCRFTGTVAALADTASTATYSSMPQCAASSSAFDTPTPCSVTGPFADLDAGQSSSATACSYASGGPVNASHYAHFFVSASSIEAVTSSRVTNIVESYYDNCMCEEGGSGSGIGGGYATVNTVGGIGLECDPGGQVLMEHDSSASSQITNRTAARNLDCDPRRDAPTSPTAAELARKSLIERDAKGEIIATHTDTFFNLEFGDGTGIIQNTLDVSDELGRSGSRLIDLDPQTASIDIETSLESSGNPVTWATWIAFNESFGSVWSDDNYRLEADLNLDGFIEPSDAELIFGHAGALDLNGDGEVSPHDVAAYLSLLASGDSVADLNMDGRLDVADLTEWKNAAQASPIAMTAR